MWKSEFQQFLIDYFDESQKRNPRFSLRAFAAKIGISHSTLSEILRAKNDAWFLSAERASEILDILHPDDRVKNRLRVLMGVPLQIQKVAFKETDYDLLSDWGWHCIAMAFELPVAERSWSALSKRFGKPESEIQKYAAALLKKGHLRERPDGTLERTKGFQENWPKETLDERIRDFHSESLHRADTCLKTYPVNERDFSVMTFVGNSKKLDLIKTEISQFMDRISVLMEPENADEVYHLGLQLFPIRPSVSGDI